MAEETTYEDFLAHILDCQRRRVQIENEISGIFKAIKAQRLDLAKAKEASKEIYFRLRERGNDELRQCAAKARAESETVCPPELRNYDDGFGPIDDGTLIDDLITKQKGPPLLTALLALRCDASWRVGGRAKLRGH
jgi:hypothetical protein